VARAGSRHDRISPPRLGGLHDVLFLETENCWGRSLRQRRVESEKNANSHTSTPESPLARRRTSVSALTAKRGRKENGIGDREQEHPLSVALRLEVIIRRERHESNEGGKNVGLMDVPNGQGLSVYVAYFTPGAPRRNGQQQRAGVLSTG